MYVPADAAMKLLLRHGFESPPSIDVLRTLCNPAAADGEEGAGLALSAVTHPSLERVRVRRRGKEGAAPAPG